eukprot:Selendium_serpulae@DN3833_c0_g1_i1.p1
MQQVNDKGGNTSSSGSASAARMQSSRASSSRQGVRQHLSTVRRRDENAQLLGRTKSERTLDGIFNRQTTELRRGERPVDSSGAREANRRQRAALQALREAKRQKLERPTRERSVAESLDALTAFVKKAQSAQKFPNIVKMMNTLFSEEHMAFENRLHYLQAAFELGSCPFVDSNVDARQDVMQLFMRLEKYAPAKFESWSLSYQLQSKATDSAQPSWRFKKAEWRLIEALRIATVLHNGLKTDDTYHFNDALRKLRTAFDREIEQKTDPDHMEVSDSSDDEDFTPPADAVKPADGFQASSDEAAVPAPGAGDPQSALSESLPPTAGGASDEPCTIEGDGREDGQAGGEVQEDAARGATPAEHEWLLPTREDIDALRIKNMMDCLKTVCSYRKMSWAKTHVDAFFLHIFLSRHKLFEPSSEYCDMIEKLQAEIKSHKATISVEKGRADGGTPHGILEPANPVRDGREEKIVTTHGSAIWSAKQLGLH